MDNVMQSIEERLIIKATNEKRPINAAFELTPNCNLNCDMCFIRLSGEEMNAQGRILSLEEWIQIALQLKEEGTLFLLLTGGEPLLYPDFEELYIKLHDMGMILTVNTNGTLITEKIGNLFSKYKPRRVNVTLYGASNETYRLLCHNDKGFTQVMEGLAILKENGIDVKLNGTVVPENEHEIDSMISIAKQFDYYIKFDTYIFPSSRKKIRNFCPSSRLSAFQAARKSVEIKQKLKNKEEFDNYRDYILSNNECTEKQSTCMECRAGKSSLWITWKGELTPCVFLEYPSYDLLDSRLGEAWNKLCEGVTDIRLPEKCADCEFRKVCQICAASAYCEMKSMSGSIEYMCDYTSSIIKELEKTKK